MLDNDQLRSFVAIVDTGSFTKAAERVNKTQSAVSMHVRRLEEQLGVSLFLKNGRGVRLSEDGDRLVDFAREILRIEASALLQVGQKGLAGRVRLGIPDDYAEPFLPAIMEGFSSRHPLVEISVVCEGSIALAERVRARDLDIALVTDCAAIAGVEVVREEPLAWIGSPKFKVEPDQPLPVALGAITCQWRQTAERILQEAERDYRIVLVSNNYSAIEPMVRTRLALTILPLGAVRPGQKVFGPSDGLPELPTSRMGILLPPSPAREAKALADLVRATIGGGDAQSAPEQAAVA